MKIIYEADGNAVCHEISNFYKEVAELLRKEPVDCSHEVTVTIEGIPGRVEYLISKRSGTQFIREMNNTLPDSLIDVGKEVFLTCVNPEVNAYKFYRLTPCGNEVKATYGRMGVSKGELFGERTFMYPLSMFWVKYQEKIGKGYVDRSDVYLDNTVIPKISSDKKKANIRNKISEASEELFERLMIFAKKAVKKAKVRVPITDAIIRYAEEKVQELRDIASDSNNVDEFNKVLIDLISVLQRPVQTGDGSGVKKILASRKEDFVSIIERESDLIAAMSGSTSKENSSGSFADYDIEVYYATDKQKEEVMRMLSDNLKGKVKNIYRVIPQEQKKKFDNYLKKNNIKVVKRFWHGSRNSNWASIIRASLMLNPNAIITGKMFGQGIYFAPSSMKSWGYTSYSGSYWANGDSNTAYMGLYATAYGNPYNVDTWTHTDYPSLVKQNHSDCLHAHAGTCLKNDEIVFFDEAAILLQYVVEFGG